MTHKKNNYQLLFYFMILLLSSCTPELSIDPSKADVKILPTTQPSETPIPNEILTLTPTKIPTLMHTPTPGVERIYDGTLLLEILSSQVWALSFPDLRIDQLVGEPGLHFANPAWSPNGEWIAYAMADTECPTHGSIWIQHLDGTELQQVGPQVTGYIDEEGSCWASAAFPANVYGWSGDSHFLAVNLGGLYVIDITTGTWVEILTEEVFTAEGIDLEDLRHDLSWHSFSRASNRALMLGFTDILERIVPVAVWIDLDRPLEGHILNFPASFNINPRRIAEAVWSPDGNKLIFAEYPTTDSSSLWLVDVETNTWTKVITWDVVDPFDRMKYIALSPDGRWIAWRSFEFDPDTDLRNIKVVFIDTETWEVARVLELEQLNVSITSWITATDGEVRLVEWVKGDQGGLILRHPIDGSLDRVLITYEELDALVDQMDYLFAPRIWEP